MTTEIHEGPLQASRTLDAPAKLSWREKRYQYYWQSQPINMAEWVPNFHQEAGLFKS